jgi:hypothetical protein
MMQMHHFCAERTDRICTGQELYGCGHSTVSTPATPPDHAPSAIVRSAGVAWPRAVHARAVTRQVVSFSCAG